MSDSSVWPTRRGAAHRDGVPHHLCVRQAAQPRPWSGLVLSLALAAAWGAGTAAQAMAVAGPEGSAAQGRRTVNANPSPAATAAAAAAVELQRGVIEAVDGAHRRIVLNGRAVALDAALRVIVPGRSASGSLAWLRAGQAIRFALVPVPALASASAAGPGSGQAVPRAIGLIYLEAQP